MVQRTQRVQGVPDDVQGYDPHGGHMWYPPGVSSVEGVTLPNRGGRVGIIGASGNWANCEVYCDVPDAWKLATFILSMKVGMTKIELDRRRPIDCEHLTATDNRTTAVDVLPPTPNARIRGVLFSNLGRPTNAALVVDALNAPDQEGNLVDGRFYIHCWGTEGQSQGDRASRPITDRWARRNQNVRFTTANLVEGATTVAIPVQLDDRAVHITDVLLTNTNVGGVPIALELFEPNTATTVVVANFTPSRDGPISVNLALPFTGLRGYQWQFTRGAGAGNVAATLNGYVS